MSDPLDIAARHAVIWDRALDQLIENPDRLVNGLRERWSENASTTAPDGLPPMPGVSDQYGWSVALELYLAQKAIANDATVTLVTAFREACALLDPADRNDVWLSDILALRRAPPRSAPDRCEQEGSIDFGVAGLLLHSVEQVGRLIPAPDADAYEYFDRIYAMLANALVSEIAEIDGPGWVRAQFQSGRRILPPDSRSIFRSLAAARPFADGWQHARGAEYESLMADWAKRIGELVDSIALVSPELEDLGTRRLPSQQHNEEQLEAVREELSRAFDDSLCRLLAADPRVSERNERLFAGIRKLGATSTLSVDPLTIQGMLWGGRRKDPLGPVSAEAVSAQPEDYLAVDEEGALRMTAMADDLFQARRRAA